MRHRGEWRNKAKLYGYFQMIMVKHGVPVLKSPMCKSLQEPGLIELEDGRVMMYISASGGFSYFHTQTIKVRHGVTSKTAIPSPLSPNNSKIPNSNDWLLVLEHNDGSDQNLKGEHPTAAISKRGKHGSYGQYSR